MAPPASPVRRTTRFLGWTGGVLAAALLVRLVTGGYLDRDAVWRFPAAGRPAAQAVLFFSGDGGMRFGMGGFMARRWAAQGIPVTAISTSTVFRLGKTRAALSQTVAGAVARAEAAAGSRRLILVGQSYGADVLQTGLADLPDGLRRGIAGVILIVPGTGAYYRADPTGLLYHFAPDSRAVTTAAAITWTPLTCIYGAQETDSLCPLLRLPNATMERLPGDHYLNHDKPRVAAKVLQAIQRAATRGIRT